MRKLTRPALLAAVALALTLCGLFGPTVSGAAAANPIVIENQNAGTTNWQLGRPGFQTADDVNKQIKGYASATSVNKGGSIDFKVSVNPAQTYTIDIYRLGWYGGLGGRLMQHVNAAAGVQQPVCPTNATTGLIECNWPTGYTLSVPTSWTTGAYVALLTNANNYQNYVPFVVRDDSGNADLLFQTSVTTYQAYNNYPNDGLTGKSLYPGNSYGSQTVSGTKRAVKVSFDRPYANTGVSELLESPDGASYGYEYHFIRWLEQNGYNVSYSTDIDTHANGANLLTHRGFLSVGHDEYWTKAMRDAAEAARDAGTSLAFFGGNDIYWQIRLEPSTTNAAPNRVEVSYKNNAPALDPVQDETMTTKWRDPPPNRPEQKLMGLQSINGAAAHLVNAPYVVQNSSNWIYAGTGFSEGSSVPGLVGYEYDRTDSDFAGHTYPSSTIVSHSPVSDGAWSDWAESIVSQAQSGAWVFDAGTIWWAWGLDKGGIVDSRIQQTTANILNRFVAGKIIIRKDSQPDDAQDFSFTTGGGLSPSSFQLDDDADPTLSNTQTFQYVAPGSGYSVSEAVPSGWDQTGATCSDGSSVSNIDLSSGETVTCTFTNRKRGKIVVVEDSQPDDPQDFGFTAGGGLSPSSFSLDDDADGTLSNTRTFSNVVPGSGYSLAETVPSGWDQTSATCDNGSAISNIGVSAGQTVTCTFTNRKRGKIVVVEDSQPNDAQDFAFTAGGGLSPSSFSLDDDANATLSNTQTFNSVVPGGGYSLSQTVPSGWDLTSSTCDDGSPISNVNVSAGETVTCTFVNIKRGQIVVVEDTQPNNGQDFSFTAGGGLSPSSFTLDDDNNPALSNTQTFAGVVPNNGYSISETVPGGWQLATPTCDDGSPVSNIDVAPGETVTCTFVNARRGKIVVVKDAQPNDPQDFAFTAGGGLSPSTFSLDDDSDPALSNTITFDQLATGTYSVSETVPSGWDQTGATCDDGSPVSAINVGAGETVTCTFTNRKRGKIVVVEDSQPDDAQNFSFAAGGGLSPSSFQLDDDLDPALSNTQTFNNVVPGGGYSLSETVPAGWDLSAACDDGSSTANINVAAGETVTCTFTNLKRGSIVVTKDSQPNDPQDFAFTGGGGLSPSSFSLDDDSDPTLSNTRTFGNLPSQSGYSLSETVPSGWDQTGASCDNGSSISNISVAPGQTVTCAFTNRKRGQIVIVKDALPNDPQDFSFSAGGGLSPASFSLDDDSNPTLSNTQTYNNVVPGSGYSISESVPVGWDQTGSGCDDGSALSNIDVSAGETVTCSFTNRKRGNIVVVENSTPNDAQDFAFTAGGGLSPASFSLDDDSDPTLQNARTFANVVPSGGYSLAETVPSGWDLTSSSCDDGSTLSNIDVSAGETVTCTFNNRKRGNIVVVENSTPNDPQDFSFSAGGGLSPASFSLDDDSDPTLQNARTFANVVPSGGYSLAETVPSGWDLTSSSCDDGSTLSNIDVAPGETVTCSFNNRKRGNIVVVENSTPNDPQDFSFSAGGGLSPASFSLDDDLDLTLSNTRTFTNVVPGGGYSLAETVPSGWDLTSSTCDDGSALSNIAVSAGETVTCTFDNRKRGNIVVVESSTPNDAQDFAFTAGGGLSPSSLSLDDDGDPTLSNTHTFANVVPNSAYSLDETVPSGWDLTSSSCDDGSALSNIDVAPGETVTCTFNNRKRGSIVVVENSTPNDPQNFDFTAGGGLSPSSFPLDDDSDPTLSNTRTFANVVPGGGYSLDETVPSGWDLTDSSCDDGSALSNIDVAPGETVTCSFNNRKRGSIVVVESSNPNDPQDFSFSAGGGLSPSSFSLDDDSDPTLSNTRTFANVVPGGGYSLDETVPSGWDLTDSSCDDGSALSNIDVAPGETVTCSFTNRKRGNIVVVENSTPNAPQDFDFTAGGGLSPSSFSLDDNSDPTLPNTHTFADVVPGGGYSLDETVPAGWDLTDSSCDDGSALSNIDVAPGETVTCSFTNRKRGKIVVVENSTPNDAQDFAFTAGGGLSPSSFSLDDDSDPTLPNTHTFGDVVPSGGYSLDETVPASWDLTSSTCDDGSALSNIDVAPGETVTCTFDNRKRGKIVVVENSTPNDAQDFAFTAGGGLSPTSFSLDDDSDPTLSNSRTFSNLVPDNGYSFDETVPAGWDLTSSSCDDGSALSNIDVAPGETVTCTFNNRKRGQLVVVENSNPNDPQNFAFSAGGGLSPSSFSLDDDSDPTLSNTRTFANVVPNSGYSLDETVPAGWDLTSSTCDDGSALSNIDVAPGETVTCTFDNRKRGQVVVVENSNPNDPQDFAFSAGGGLSPSALSLDDDADPTLQNTHTFTNVVPGSGYSLSETVPNGWDLTSSSCDDGSALTNVAVAPGETVTCTFDNRKRGNIVVVESSTPNDPQNFDFTAGGGLSPSSFSLDDDSDLALSNTRTFSDVMPGGGYSLDETVPSGWDLMDSSCDDGSALSNIDISPGETVTCSFSNRKRGNIVVVENSTPNAPQDFAFTAGGGLSPSSFSLDDDSDPTLSNTRTFSDLVPGSGYSLDETVPSNWDLTDSSCDDGSALSNIDVSAGETVTCSFNNRKRGKVVLVESSNPNDAQDFDFTAGGGLSPTSLSLDDDSDPTLPNTHTFANVVPGSGYSLAETVPSGWDLTSSTCDDGSALSNIDVAPGETVTCTFDNRKRGNIVVVENSTPNAPQDFDFTAGGGLSPSSFSLDDNSDPTLPNTHTFADVVPGGGYSLDETVPAGWDLTDSSCNDGSALSNIDVAPGETVTCSFNNRKRGKIVVVENSTPNDAQDFAFTAGGGLSPSSFSLDDDSDPTISNTMTFANVVPGSGYSLSEAVPSGWDLTAATCDNGSLLTSIDIGPGETVTCTFNNRKRGKIVVVENSTPNDPQDFSFSAGGGLSPTSFSLDDDSDPTLSNIRTFNYVAPGGGYSLSETVPSGWNLSNATCDDGSATSNIDISAGETVTCTFTNEKRGKIIVRKDAQPNDPQDFAFTAGGGLSPSSFSLDDDSDPTLSNTETFDNLIPRNNYSISESVPGSWDQIGATCDDGSPVTNVDVAPAETVTCTFTNRAHATIVVKLDAQPNHAQDFAFTAGGGLSPSSFSLDDDADPALSNTQTFNSITPGSGYSVSAAVPSGWKQTGNACDDGSPVSNIGVSVGETVTCTFVEVKGYQRPQSGSTLDVSLVPTFKQCGTGGNSVTRKHAPPLNVGSCTTGPTSTLAVAGIQSVGSAHFTVVPGDTNPSNGDQADVQLSTSITDVQSSTGADYTPVTNGPDMTMITRLRITDEQNCSLPCGGSYAQPATLTELDFAVPIDCANTPGSSIGATCTANTTADAISPGMITENRSSILQAFRVRINDAGANRVRGDADDKLFEQQGFFNP